MYKQAPPSAAHLSNKLSAGVSGGMRGQRHYIKKKNMWKEWGKDTDFICIKINFACHLFVVVAPLEFYFSDFRRHSNCAPVSSDFFPLILFCSNCKPCPVAKPTFLCGADNRTYSSLCRLDYHNCIHSTSIRITCKGFCPCKGESIPYPPFHGHNKRTKTNSTAFLGVESNAPHNELQPGSRPESQDDEKRRTSHVP